VGASHQDVDRLALRLHPCRYSLQGSAGERVTSWEDHKGRPWRLLIRDRLVLRLEGQETGREQGQVVQRGVANGWRGSAKLFG